MKCKVCEQDKAREMKMDGDRYVYRDLDGKQWNGKICPPCASAAKKQTRGFVSEKRSCAYCNRPFDSKRQAQVVCSLACRSKRRGERTKARLVKPIGAE